MMQNFFKYIRNEQSGMALLMVISSIALLTYLLADFSFETQINQLKAYNAQDRLQARLTAEAGLHFSLAKLKIFQEVKNKMAKNKNLGSLISETTLDKVLLTPFVYPIPTNKKMGLIQRNAIKEFSRGTVLRGDLNITITKVSGFLNPNNLRIVSAPTSSSDGDQKNTKEKTPSKIIEEKILQILQNLFEELRETSDTFNAHYSNLDPELLVKELSYFVNNREVMKDDPYFPEIEQVYNEKGLRAKHAPMTSLEEFHLLELWPEFITEKVINRFTVHEVGIISLNELNLDTLKLIFPNITELQTEEFFRYRDGSDEFEEEGHPFKSVKDFKNLVVNELRILSSVKFDERQKEFKNAHLTFGVSGKLYKVESRAKFNTSTVTLTAFIDLPLKPQKEEKEKKKQTSENPEEAPPSSQRENQKEDKKEEKVEYMSPRIIEIRAD